MSGALPVIAVLGGTGAEGGGLAFRWAHAGYKVIIGSRSAERAEDAAREIGHDNLSGADNETAARTADICVLAVPFAAQEDTLRGVVDHLQGKILIDVTVPLVPPKVSRVQLPPEGSAAERAQAIVGDGVKVVSAFQNVSATHLRDLAHDVDCDVLICGDDKDARAEVAALARAAGMRGWEAGVLANAVAAESLTPVLIAINRRYKIPGSGIRITGGSPDDE